MTTATAQRQELEQAGSSDVQRILRDTFALWNAGMSRADYVEWTAWQFSQPWARKHLRYFLLRSGKEIAASCKLYSLDMSRRGKHYRVAGIGAVFTMPRFRGQGFASTLIEQIKRLCEREHYDAMLLFSDIDPSFYEQLGFELMSDHEFYIQLSESSVEAQILSDSSFAADLQEHVPDLGVVDSTTAGDMLAHHARWLPTVPFAVARDDLYWRFKLGRELFVQEHSGSRRPQLEQLTIDSGSADGGYAIFEQSTKIMRVLEVVGKTEARDVLWRSLLRTAMLRRVQLIRGWEAVAPLSVHGIKYVSRETARPMWLAFNDECEGWADVVPCPLLELDHF